jgi:hypothetical protein
MEGESLLLLMMMVRLTKRMLHPWKDEEHTLLLKYTPGGWSRCETKKNRVEAAEQTQKKADRKTVVVEHKLGEIGGGRRWRFEGGGCRLIDDVLFPGCCSFGLRFFRFACMGGLLLLLLLFLVLVPASRRSSCSSRRERR